jgi:hypothetical protein
MLEAVAWTGEMSEADLQLALQFLALGRRPAQILLVGLHLPLATLMELVENETVFIYDLPNAYIQREHPTADLMRVG